jgi:excisionase family DNA binding protein
MPAGTLLRTEEVAALLRVHPKHVYRLLKKGLPGRRVGGEWRFSREDVLAWSGGREPLAGPTERPGAGIAEGAPPSVVAANGDVVVMRLLALATRGPPLIGFVQADVSPGRSSCRPARCSRLARTPAGSLHSEGPRGAIHPVTREVASRARDFRATRVKDSRG